MNEFLRARVRPAAMAVALAAVGSAAASAQSNSVPPPSFGSPPSGAIPILFNDHHVYAKPDKLVKRDRVLAAIVRNGTILIPLRSMFEQTGATVSYDPKTKTVDAATPGADVRVTVGKPTVTVNGVERPLDVPPEIDGGIVLVPVRVIAEGLGAYVQWVYEKRVVVVRYNAAPPPTPVPTVAPTEAPTAAPTAVPTVAPAPKATPFYDRFVSADFAIQPKISNELSPGNTGNSSYKVKGAAEFPLFGQTWMLEGNYRAFRYPHGANVPYGGCVVTAAGGGCNTVVGNDPIYQIGVCPAADEGCVTAVGYQLTQAFNGLGQAYVPGFEARESDFDAHLGWRVAEPRIYVGIGGFFKNYKYLAYPNLSGFGFGLQKLPDLNEPLSLYGSVWYYPSVSGKYTFPTSVLLGPLSAEQITLSYSWLTYEVGGTFNFGKTGAFLDAGFLGERARAKENAPTDTTITAPYVGLGYHFK